MSKTKCPTCGRDDFRSERGMKNHHKRTHGESIAGAVNECSHCGHEYREKYSRSERTSFCSTECYHSNMEGNGSGVSKVSLTCQKCGDTYLVKEYREDTSDYCSASCHHNAMSDITGKEHPLYDGGGHNKYKEREWRHFSKKYREWVGECEYCGNEDNLQTHHVYPLSIGGDMFDNEFIVLCSSCHYGDYNRWHPPELEDYIGTVK